MIKRFFIISVLIAFAAQLFGGVIEKEITFETGEFTFTKSNGYDVVFLPKAFSTTDIGSPMLPKLSVKLLIPPGATAKSVEIISSKKIGIPGEFNIIPVQRPVKISSTEPPEFVQPHPDLYNSDEPYPGKLVSEAIHNGTKCGYRIASFSIYPMQYMPSKKQLVLYKNMHIKLNYEEGKHPIRKVTEKQKEVFCESVKHLVMNKQEIERFSPPLRTSYNGSRTLPSGNYEYVLIASEDDSSYFSPLTYWKNKKGVPAKIVTTEYIYSNYSGANDQERIKKFIDDANTTWGAIWFALGGDVGWVPYRGCYGYVETSPPTEDYGIPCERYFEDLDNNWNYTSDSKYGYTNDGPWGGDIDMYADVYVGRIPVDNSSEAQRVVNNILQYEKNPPSGYLEKIVYFSEYLFGDKYGMNICEDLIVPKIPSGWTHTKRYNEKGWYSSDDQAVGDMNNGYGFNMVASHGDWNMVMAGQSSAKNITVSDLSNLLQSGDKRGIHTGICCISGAFDQGTCYAEQLLNDVYAKVVASMFNSRYGWGNTGTAYAGSAEFCEDLFDKIFNENVFNIGQALAETRDNYVSQAGSYSGWDGVYRWCLFEYNLLGDPEMPVWTEEPIPLSATHASVVPTGPSIFDVNVTDGSKAPVNNALVCLRCDTETSMYVTGYTNSSGDVSLSINPSIDGDIMRVTATKHNYLPYEGSATVDEDVSIFLSSFTAVSNKQNVEIQWKTESETNNSCWIIERSKDNCSNWGEIANILGQGTKPIPTEYSYIDNGIDKDGRYYYRLDAIGSNGDRKKYGPISIFVRGHIPNQYALHKIHPSPSSDRTTIYYDIPKRSYVSLKIYDISGRLVQTLVSSDVEPGYYSILWDGCNKNGNKVANGTYFLRMNAEQYIKTQKLLFVK
jgi:hypothetical protein